MKQIQVNKNQRITKNTIIQDILAENPEKAMLLSEILLDFGIHCVGCGASGFETLEDGVLGHGFTEKELDKLVINLNNAVKKKSKTKQINNFSIKLTDKAASKLKEIMEKEGKEHSYLRASVLSGGCSGYSYDLELVDSPAQGDFKVDQKGIKILVDQESAEFINGTEISFIDTLKESGFKFNNPNATKECGCGKSFS